MDLGLKGKTALVAASSKGLGKAIAKGLASEGANVCICARTQETLEATATEIRQDTGADVLAVTADVSQPQDVQRLVEAVVEQFGGLDILINNAGGPPAGTFDTIPEEAYQGALELNLLSTVNLCRAAVPIMKEHGWGRVINMTSISVKQPIAGLMLSNMARAGVIGFAKTLATELAPHGILVNSVCPGIIFTDRITQLAESRSQTQGITPQQVIANMEADIPVGRLGKPDELANLVVFLCSERASYITGTTIQADGGMYKGLQ